MKKILFFAIVLFAVNSRAQTYIGITNFGPSPASDTVMAGSSHTYNVWVKNNGPGAFNGSLKINTAIRDSAFAGLDSLDNFDAGTQSIPAGDSLLFTLTADYNVGPLGYRYGIDVIVIWPYALGNYTSDSLEFTVYILDPNGTNELDVSDLISLYPNPSAGRISINNNSGIEVESIAIYDLSGKLVISNKDRNMINTESLTPGMYQTEVILSDKSRHTFKIIKQKKTSE